METILKLKMEGIGSKSVTRGPNYNPIESEKDKVSTFIKDGLKDLNMSENDLDLIVESVINMFNKINLLFVNPMTTEVTITLAKIDDYDYESFAKKHGYGELGDARRVLDLDGTVFIIYGMKEKTHVLLSYFKDES